MGIPILVMGESGCGKSRSMKSFEKGDIAIFNVASKPLPFKNSGLAKIDISKSRKDDSGNMTSPTALDRYNMIKSGLMNNKYNTFVIDDSQFLLGFESMDRAKEKGFDKPLEIGQNFYNLVKMIVEQTSDDTVVYLLHHTTVDGEVVKAKTLSKMLDNQLSLEGMFSVVLYAKKDDGVYKFVTQSDGYTTAKSPEEMFELEIDNDLKFVDDTIREYWDLAPRKKATAITKKQ